METNVIKAAKEVNKWRTILAREKEKVKLQNGQERTKEKVAFSYMMFGTVIETEIRTKNVF